MVCLLSALDAHPAVRCSAASRAPVELGAIQILPSSERQLWAVLGTSRQFLAPLRRHAMVQWEEKDAEWVWRAKFGGGIEIKMIIIMLIALRRA